MKYNWTHIFFIVAALVIVGCLLFGCSFSMEGLELKDPTPQLQEQDEEDGADLLQKEMAGSMLTAGQKMMSASPNPLDTDANVSVQYGPDNVAPVQDESFSNYY